MQGRWGRQVEPFSQGDGGRYDSGIDEVLDRYMDMQGMGGPFPARLEIGTKSSNHCGLKGLFLCCTVLQCLIL